MPTPSLLIVPARFKTGRLYSQIPTSGAGDFTVTRNTEARRFGPDGLIASVASGIPRLDYYTSGGVTGCPALLVEPAATNTFIESETLFTTHLVQNLTSGYTNATASPDGNVTAEKFVPNTTNGVHGIANGSSLAITSGTTYTLSLFVKSDGGPYNLISLTFDSTTAWGATRNCIFNASNGTNFAVPSGATMTSENYGNGWYRIRATLTAVGTVAASTFQYRIYVADASGNLSWLPPSGNTNGVFCWGAQLETGSVATSYIPTTAGTGSRSADVVSVSGAVSGSIGQTEGTAYIEVDFTQGFKTGAYILTLRSSNIVFAVLLIRANGRLGFQVSNTSPSVDLGNVAAGQLSNAVFKIAFAYKSGDYALYMNGNQVATSASTGVPTSLNEIRFSSESTLGNDPLQGKVRAVALYTTRLTNAELAALTSP